MNNEKNKHDKSTPAFYDHYFDTSDYDVFRGDVGGFCTRSAIIKKITHTSGNLLEIGTGISSVLEDTPQFKRYGIDISEKTVNQIQGYLKQKKVDAQILVADAQALPFDDNFFDVIVSAHTFEHIENDIKAFQECERILKPGGKLILFVPGRIDGTATKEEWDKLGHYRSYNRQRFLDLQKTTPTLKLISITFPHKIHNFFWNRLKHVVRWMNYPIKKWIFRDNKTYEIRPFYKKFIMPALVTTLDTLDLFVHQKEKNFLGTEFNILACFEKLRT